MIDYLHYFSIPYKKNGRDERTGLDCWGFVRYFLKREKEILLPSFSNVDNKESLKEVILDFKQVNTPSYFDIVLMKGLKNNLTHVGIFLENELIHMSEKGVSTVKLKRIEHLILGYYSFYL